MALPQAQDSRWEAASGNCAAARTDQLGYSEWAAMDYLVEARLLVAVETIWAQAWALEVLVAALPVA
jgi:hypothetical protein